MKAPKVQKVVGCFKKNNRSFSADGADER